MNFVHWLRPAAASCVALLCMGAANALNANDEVTSMPATDGKSSTTVYIGTYTGKSSEGIYRFRLDHADGRLHLEGLAAEVKNPSFLAVSPDNRYLYCINEISDMDGRKSGGATSFAIDGDNIEVAQLDLVPSGGLGPCYVSVTADGNAILTANYGSGSVALLPAMDDGGLGDPISVSQHEGASGVVPKRQDGPHAHCIKADPSGRFALAVDLGLDQVIAYRLASESHQMDTSSPVVNKVHPGAGPRHIAFHPNGKIAYTSNELDSTISTWEWASDTGRLTEIEHISTLPDDTQTTNFPSEVLVHPSGKFVYLANRGHNSIAVFNVDEPTGKLKLAGTESTRGEHPRGMAMDAAGKFIIVGNQNSANVVAYRINQSTGMPEYTSEHKGLDRPVGIVFLNNHHQDSRAD